MLTTVHRQAYVKLGQVPGYIICFKASRFPLHPSARAGIDARRTFFAIIKVKSRHLPPLRDGKPSVIYLVPW